MNDLVALPDNQHALSGSREELIELFNVNNGAVLRTFPPPGRSVVQRIFMPLGRTVTCLALLPACLRFVSGSTDKTARIV